MDVVPPGSGYVGRLFDVIEALVGAGVPLGPRPLSRLAGVERNATARALRSLTEAGILERDGGSYSFAARFFALCRAGIAIDSASNAVSPAIEKLMHEFGESAVAFRRSGDQIVLTHAVESEKSIRYVADRGTMLPLYAGSPGRAILAALPDAQFESYLTRTDLIALTGRTIITPDDLRAATRTARRHGYCTSLGEAVDGGWGVAAPYFDESGACLGALSVLGPLSRPPDDMTVVGEAVRSAAQGLSERLGYINSPT